MVRVKNRYIIAHYLYPTGSSATNNAVVRSRDLQQSLREKIQELYGDMGSGDYGNNTMVKYLDESTHIFVVRVPQDAQVQVHFALSCLMRVKEIELVIHSLSVKSCARTCLQALREIMHRAYGQMYVDPAQYQNEVQGLEKTLMLVEL